jgi:ParB-like chromosome segregation protein Spo0J
MASAEHLLDLLGEVVTLKNKDHLSQKEIGERLGESQQSISRMLFLLKAGNEVISSIRRQNISKTALTKLIDISRAKTRNRTLQTKVAMFKRLLAEYGEERQITKTKASTEKKLDENRIRLVEITGENFMLREGKKELVAHNEDLQDRIQKINRQMSLYRLSLKDALGGKKPKTTLTPDLRYLLDAVKSSLGGVRVSIEGQHVLLDCMTESYRDLTLERLTSVKG